MAMGFARKGGPREIPWTRRDCRAPEKLSGRENLGATPASATVFETWSPLRRRTLEVPPNATSKQFAKSRGNSSNPLQIAGHRAGDSTLDVAERIRAKTGPVKTRNRVRFPCRPE